jgi:hypothetical protein
MTVCPIILTDSHIIVGNSSNVGADVAMSGDVTIDDTGMTTIKTNVALAGSPTTTTQSAGDSSTKIATTAFVSTSISALTAGLDAHPSCRVATTAALTATYSNGSSGVGATLTNSGTQAAISIDGVSLAASNRVLVKNQATAAQNGIYTVTTVGSGATNWVLTRATDFNTASATGVEEGAFTVIEEGTALFGTLWIETGQGPFTIGTTAITFTQLQVTNVNLTNGHILVGNASNIAADVAMSGDVTITNAGVTAIKSSVALAGNPTTTTQSAGDNSTKIATTAYVDAGLSGKSSSTLTSGHLFVGNGSNVATDTAITGDVTFSNAGVTTLASNLKVESFGITVDGGGSVPSTGSKGFITLPYAGTITNWYLAADASGSCVIDLKRSGTSIVGGGNKPTLSSAQSGNAAVSGWTSTSISAGDIIEFNLNSVSTITRVNLVIKINLT